MSHGERQKERIKERIHRELGAIFETARCLYERPELGNQEVYSCERLCEDFRRYGFFVEKGFCAMPTAFRAVLDSGKPGPSIGYCAEYDALPEVGHGCGHNLVGTMALGAAAGLASVLSEIGGRIVVYGTPAEETQGGKVAMAASGVFRQVDVVMMAHPAAVTEESGSSLAMNALQFQFYGKATHAAASPERGINALEGVIQLFNGINALRQHLPRGVLVHGIITKGGTAPNIIPDFAEARFYVRAPEKFMLAEAVRRIRAVAHGAEGMTGTRVEISEYESSYDNMETNQRLNKVICGYLRELGDPPRPSRMDGGSLDMGNVSHRAPSAHIWVGFGEPELVCHTKEFAAMTVGPKGKELLYRGACALALTGYSVIAEPGLLGAIKKEFHGLAGKG